MKARPPNRVRDRDLPPATRKRVMALRAELASILTERCKRLLYVIREMAWARTCIYNGLSFQAYQRTRAICKNRSESLDALRAYRRGCNHNPRNCDAALYNRLFRERQRAVAACNKIGWDGDKDCPSLSALKAEFDRTKHACRGKAERAREIRREINDAKGESINPSAAPLVRESI